MQTFYPYMHPKLTAESLDRKRLGKQRVEASQILDLLEGRVNNNWINHPAVRMWGGYNMYLRYYYNTMIEVWVNRGYENNMIKLAPGVRPVRPWWHNDPRLLYSHRANLVKKFPEYYEEKWPYVNPDIPYWWPVELKTKKNQDHLNDFWGWHKCVRTDDHQIILELRNEKLNTPVWEPE